MVHLSELRIVMPFTVEEFQRGQRFANWRTNEDATEPGKQGGTLLNSTPYYHDEYGEGLFTHSIYKLGNRLPDWVSSLIPPSALVVDEKSWISYPFMRSIITIPFFSKLKVEVVSTHLNDDGSSANALSLSDDDLKIRKIDFVDIGSEKVAKRDYKAELDPLLVRSKVTGRGPLSPGWQQREKPLMCAYKVVKAEANYWGVGSRAEKLLIDSLRQIFLLAHKNCFGLTDLWYHLTYDQVMELEMESHKRIRGLSGFQDSSEQSVQNSTSAGEKTRAARKVENSEKLRHSASSPSLLGDQKNERKFEEGDEAKQLGGEKSEEATAASDSAKCDDVGLNVNFAHHQEGPSTAPPVSLRLRSSSSLGKEEGVRVENFEKLGGGHDEDELGVEFHEAQMEWAVQEELAAEEMFPVSSSIVKSSSSPLPSPLFSSNVATTVIDQAIGGITYRPPTSELKFRSNNTFCSVCAAQCVARGGGREGQREEEEEVRDAKVECVSCGEYFCRMCFQQFHCTPRLKSHRVRILLTPRRHSSEANSAVAIERKDNAPLESPLESIVSGIEKKKRGEEGRFDQRGDRSGQKASEQVAHVASPVPSSSVSSSSYSSLPECYDANSRETPAIEDKPDSKIKGFKNKDAGSAGSRAREVETLEKVPSLRKQRNFKAENAPMNEALVFRELKGLENSDAWGDIRDQLMAELSRKDQSMLTGTSFPSSPSSSSRPPPFLSSPSSSLASFSLEISVKMAEAALNILRILAASELQLESLKSDETKDKETAVVCSPHNYHHCSDDPYGLRERGARAPSSSPSTRISASSSHLTSPVSSLSPRPSSRLIPVTRLYVGAAFVTDFVQHYVDLCRLSFLLPSASPPSLSHEEKVVFWINVHNAAVAQSFLIFGIPKTTYKRVVQMQKATYLVGEFTFSILSIEHSVLRNCSYRPAIASLLPVPRFRPSDRSFAYALQRAEPLVNFALCSGFHSAPAFRVLYPKSFSLDVPSQLRSFARSFLLSACACTASSSGSSAKSPSQRVLLLPKLLHWYGKDFAEDTAGLIRWILSVLLPSTDREDKREEDERASEELQQGNGSSSDWAKSSAFHSSCASQQANELTEGLQWILAKQKGSNLTKFVQVIPYNWTPRLLVEEDNSDYLLD